MKRAVYARDRGRCTYACPKTGKHCECRGRLEYDHVIPIALGGASTVGNLRLRCRPHNQLEAERAFGRRFMEKKRSESDDPEHRDLVSGLRGLGDRTAEAREAASFAMRGDGLSLEQRMRAALTWFKPPGTTVAAPAAP